MLRRLGSPTALTALLTACLAGAGALLLLQAPTTALLPPPPGTPPVLVAAVLALAFFLAELGQGLVEVRRQAYSFSATTSETSSCRSSLCG